MVKLQLCWISVIIGASLALRAEPALTNAPAAAGRPPGLGFEFRGSYRHSFKAHLEGGGEVESERALVGVSYRRPLTSSLKIMLDFDPEWVSYDFSGTPYPEFNRAGFMRDATVLWFGAMVAGDINPKWSWQAGGRAGLASEHDADLTDALVGVGLFGVGYVVNPDLKLSLSLAGLSVESQSLVIPVPGIDWKISERYRLATRGPGLNFVTTLDPKTRLTMRGNWDYRQFHLNDDDPTPGGMFYDQRVNLALELARRFAHIFEAALEGGVPVYQQFQIRDRDDNKVRSLTADPAPFFAVRMSAMF